MNRRSILTTAAATLAACSIARAATPQESLLARYVALKNAHDASNCAEIYQPDYVEHSGRNGSGIEALIANWKAQFDGVPDIHLTLEDAIYQGDKVVARITYSGTHTRPFAGIAPTGRAFTFGTIDIWRVRDGKFAEHWDQVDFAGLVRQLKG